MELKIRDDIDLKELEKFGFEYLDKCGKYKFTERNFYGTTYVCINAWNRKILYRQDNAWNRKILYRQDNENDNMCLGKLYDLIKANLVVKE